MDRVKRKAFDAYKAFGPIVECPDCDLRPPGSIAFDFAPMGNTLKEGDTYTFTSGAESWGGWSNNNVAVYPLTLPEDKVITFRGSVPDGVDANVHFRFEYSAWPDTEPSFTTDAVTVSGSDEATYTIAVPAQGANTFSSFLMYITERDVGVVVQDVAIS